MTNGEKWGKNEKNLSPACMQSEKLVECNDSHSLRLSFELSYIVWGVFLSFGRLSENGVSIGNIHLCLYKTPIPQSNTPDRVQTSRVNVPETQEHFNIENVFVFA